MLRQPANKAKPTTRMNDAATFVASAIGAALLAEIVIRCALTARLRGLTETWQKSWRVITARNISDHWKERALLAYSIQLFRGTGFAFLQLAIALAVLLAAPAALSLILHVPFDVQVYLQLPFNAGALIGATVYVLLRRAVTKWKRTI